MKLRFTGEWPPRSLWPERPNWEHALNEEGLPDHDETTLRPSPERETIGPDVAFTGRCIHIRVNSDGSSEPAV